MACESGRGPALFDPHLVVRKLPGVHEVHGVIGSGNSGYAFCCTVDVENSTVENSRRRSVVRLVENSEADHGQEVQQFMKLSHPNIMQLYKIVSGKPDAYYFEFCAGGCIFEAVHSLDKGDHWSKLLLWQRARIALDIGMALEFLHDHGIAHRDVTLKNCFVEERLDIESLGASGCLPKAKLGYLGVSCTNAVYLTTRGLGTVRSMAPEVIASNSYGAAADMYAFGMLLYELATQMTPYSSLHCTAAALALAVCRGLRPELDVSVLGDGSRGSQSVKALLGDLWAEDPATRPDASRAVARLSELAQPPSEPPPNPPPKAAAPPPSRPGPAAAAAAAAAASRFTSNEDSGRAGAWIHRSAEPQDESLAYWGSHAADDEMVCIQEARSAVEPESFSVSILGNPRSFGGRGMEPPDDKGAKPEATHCAPAPNKDDGLGVSVLRRPLSLAQRSESANSVQAFGSFAGAPPVNRRSLFDALEADSSTVCIQARRQMPIEEPEDRDKNWVKIL